MASHRLAEFMSWAGLTQGQLAAKIHVHQTFVGRLLSGKRTPGLDAAIAIERVTSQPREDGELWALGPIRAAEWVHEPTLASADDGGECAR